GLFRSGIGFVIEPEEAEELKREDPRNAEVLFPYLNGQDLNSSPAHEASRWAINFFDWPLERARRYPKCLAIVEERVKPHRDGLKNKPRVKENWWRYEYEGKELYEALTPLSRALVIARVSKTVQPVFVSK